MKGRNGEWATGRVGEGASGGLSDREVDNTK
jgi:hypothetical protein